MEIRLGVPLATIVLGKTGFVMVLLIVRMAVMRYVGNTKLIINIIMLDRQHGECETTVTGDRQCYCV